MGTAAMRWGTTGPSSASQAFVDMMEWRGILVGLYLCLYLEEVLLTLCLGRRYLYGKVNEDTYFVKRETKTTRTINKRRKMISHKKVVAASMARALTDGLGVAARVAPRLPLTLVVPLAP